MPYSTNVIVATTPYLSEFGKIVQLLNNEILVL